MAEIPAEAIRNGVRHLKQADPVMRELIEAAGPFTLKLTRNRFDMLVRSILSQQVSIASARAHRQRLQALVKPRRMTPERLLELSDEQLRSAGVSRQKQRYLRSLAECLETKELKLRSLHLRTDAEVIEELTQVKGIGVWTAQMFLIFCLGRLDVFPFGDLGVRVALQDLYNGGEVFTEEEANRIVEPWRPFATIGSWYCWRKKDLQLGLNSASAAEFPV